MRHSGPALGRHIPVSNLKLGAGLAVLSHWTEPSPHIITHPPRSPTSSRKRILFAGVAVGPAPELCLHGFLETNFKHVSLTRLSLTFVTLTGRSTSLPVANKLVANTIVANNFVAIKFVANNFVANNFVANANNFVADKFIANKFDANKFTANKSVSIKLVTRVKLVQMCVAPLILGLSQTKVATRSVFGFTLAAVFFYYQMISLLQAALQIATVAPIRDLLLEFWI